MSASISKYLALLGGAALLSASPLGQQALAAKPDAGQGPGNHVRILEVHANSATGIIDILGESFDFVGPVSVSLGTVGDITDSCEAVDAEIIRCDLGDDFPGPGDYLLTVTTGFGQSKGDEYDLTVGTSGAVSCPCFTAEEVFSLGTLMCRRTSSTLTLIEAKKGAGLAEVTQVVGGENSCRFCPAGDTTCIRTKALPTPITSDEAAACVAILVTEIVTQGIPCT